MSSSSFRGWLLGLGLAVGSGVGSYVAISHGQQAQDERMQQVVDELSVLRKAVMSRPPIPPPSGDRVVAVGMPASVKSGEVKLGPEELDALAARMVVQLKQSGALSAPAREEQPPKPPPPLNPEQEDALVRADGLVDQVLASGRMTLDDVHAIRRELSAIKGRKEADDVRRRIIVALNRNQLVPPEGPEALP